MGRDGQGEKGGNDGSVARAGYVLGWVAGEDGDYRGEYGVGAGGYAGEEGGGCCGGCAFLIAFPFGGGGGDGVSLLVVRICCLGVSVPQTSAYLKMSMFNDLWYSIRVVVCSFPLLFLLYLQYPIPTKTPFSPFRKTQIPPQTTQKSLPDDF